MTARAIPPDDPVDTPLIEVEANLGEDGHGGQFRALAGGELQCLTCRATFPASARHADRMVRLEGASDPADMLAVIPLLCPVCGGSGTFIAHYGPEASVEEAEVLRALGRTPTEGDDLDEPTPGVR
jgi:hypothetical protein